jgi:hypothetical protein
MDPTFAQMVPEPYRDAALLAIVMLAGLPLATCLILIVFRAVAGPRVGGPSPAGCPDGRDCPFAHDGEPCRFCSEEY